MNTKNYLGLFKIVLLGSFVLLFMHCSLLDDLIQEPTPTKTHMEGVWQVVEAYDADGSAILPKIQSPAVTALHLEDDNSVTSTVGPLAMYIVYGSSKYVEIASKIDQVFNYLTLDFTDGEFFIDGGVVDRFTLEVKLKGLPGQSSLKELLGLLGISFEFLEAVVYHKFLDVAVSFQGANADTMIWELDDKTTATYNTKDGQGNYVLWGGWPATNFSRCRIVLHKRVKTLIEVVQEGKLEPLPEPQN